MNFHLPALITALTLLLLFAVAWNVGRARAKYKIEAPATTGALGFELAFRVQMNTIENAVVFLPALWLFSWYVSPAWAGSLGAVWLIGRIWYAIAYAHDASGKRGPGFVLAMLVFAILVTGSLIAIIRQLI